MIHSFVVSLRQAVLTSIVLGLCPCPKLVGLTPPGAREGMTFGEMYRFDGRGTVDAISRHLGEIPVGAYNLCTGYEVELRRLEDAIAGAHPEQFQPGAKERIAQTRELVRMLRAFGLEYHVRGALLYPCSGFDTIASAALLIDAARRHKAPLTFVHVTYERFGAFCDIETFVRNGLPISDALVSDFGMIFPQYDTVALYGRMMEEYGLRGGGMIGIMRLILYFGAHIDGIYYFTILDDGRMRFYDSTQADRVHEYGANAVVRFSLPGERLRGTYIHISQNLFQLNPGYERCVRSLDDMWGCVLIKAALSIFNIPYNFAGNSVDAQRNELRRRHMLWRNSLEPVIDSSPRALVIADPDLRSDSWDRSNTRHIFREAPLRVPLMMSIGYKQEFHLTRAEQLLSLTDIFNVPGMGYLPEERKRLELLNCEIMKECAICE